MKMTILTLNCAWTLLVTSLASVMMLTSCASNRTTQSTAPQFSDADGNTGTAKRLDAPVTFADYVIVKETDPWLTRGKDDFDLTPDMVGRKVVFFGQLHGSVFHAFSYNGHRVTSRPYYVKGRINKRPPGSMWVTVDTTITQVEVRGADGWGRGKDEIEIHTHKGLTVEEKLSVARAKAKSLQWASENQEFVDLNDFKKISSLLPKTLLDGDLNRLPRRELSEIRSLDLKRGVAQIACSRFVIYEEPSHSGAFLDLMVLFDLKKSRVVGVIVKAERYLLE